MRGGKGIMAKNHHCGTKDHPRVRGEKDGRKRNLDGRPGITPACAGEKGTRFPAASGPWGSPPRARGKSGSAQLLRRQARDHPRVRGEKVPWVLPGNTQPGSPPACAGKSRVRLELRPPHRGSPPACAGKSRLTLKSPALPGDHPRVRGEKTKRIPILSHFYPDAPLVFPLVSSGARPRFGSRAGPGGALAYPAKNAGPASSSLKSGTSNTFLRATLSRSVQRFVRRADLQRKAGFPKKGQIECQVIAHQNVLTDKLQKLRQRLL